MSSSPSTPPITTNKSVQRLYSSAVATVFAELVTMPICTVKTNYQIQSPTTVKPIHAVVRDIYHTHGLRGFYASSLPAIASQVLSTTSKYTFYRWLDTHPNNPVRIKFANGLMAGVASSLMTHPFDFFKLHIQADIPSIPQIRRNGVRVLYRGYTKTLWKVCFSSTFFFPLYDYFYAKTGRPTVSASMSAFLTTLLFHPVDYMKTRHVIGMPIFLGYNPLAYYKGVSLNMARIVPHFTLTMYIIDLAEREFWGR